MDLMQLRYFSHAAETENFSETARSFYVPTSAVSVSIKRLETELGTQLFTHTSNRITLNSNGASFHEYVRQALALIDEGVCTLRGRCAEERLRVGTRLGRRVVTPAIEHFLKKYPDVKVEHSKFGPDSRLEDYDVVITDDSPQSEQFEKVTVLRERMVLVAAKGILPDGELTPEILKKQNFVSLPRDSVMYQNTLCVCRDLGFEPKMFTEDSVYFVPRSVEQGVGVALTYPHAQWFTFMAHLLDVRDLGEYYRTLCVYYRKKGASRHPELFCEILLKHFP